MDNCLTFINLLSTPMLNAIQISENMLSTGNDVRRTSLAIVAVIGTVATFITSELR
jgi:hypothetical protein